MRRRQWVTIDGRKFSVLFDEANDPVSIAERVFVKGEKPWLCYYTNRPYWHANHHAEVTIPYRVLEAADAEVQG